MAEPTTKEKEDELSTGELATYGISPKLPAEPKLVKDQEPETERKRDRQ